VYTDWTNAGSANYHSILTSDGVTTNVPMLASLPAQLQWSGSASSYDVQVYGFIPASDTVGIYDGQASGNSLGNLLWQCAGQNCGLDGVFLYRVRAIASCGAKSAWSHTYYFIYDHYCPTLDPPVCAIGCPSGCLQ
jgi:hypothetical protein